MGLVPEADWNCAMWAARYAAHLIVREATRGGGHSPKGVEGEVSRVFQSIDIHAVLLCRVKGDTHVIGASGIDVAGQDVVEIRLAPEVGSKESCNVGSRNCPLLCVRQPKIGRRNPTVGV